MLKHLKSFIIVTWMLSVFSCRHSVKPQSKDYIKVKITDSGHKDSVIDNKQRLYNASIPEPCLKCLIAEVRNAAQLKQYVNSADSSKLVYQIDWASGPKLKDSLEKAGSGMIIHVLRKTSALKDTLAVFTFDNVVGQLYFINDKNGKQLQTVKLDSLSRLKIRNACFWGVASGK
jgi:hypothetical protein